MATKSLPNPSNNYANPQQQTVL